ncbi:choice-of-anchor D domain-containing protein [Actinospica sp.]|uniref:choice-of-anchor D domain-containing protein n=1 Tax=Actinospica sp. TaxID=1872142 RepID=UPI002CCDCC0A|nr:choice-of-anchor D domain-containing protein [Actinospica sp.]HWG25892.1 choice-of-anchor D domain-containing protein [Actinospica sp.]
MRHSVPPAQPPSSRRRSRRLIAMCTAAATAFAGLMLVIVPAPAALAAASTATAYQSPGTPSPSVAGATTPFTTYQAPEGQLGGGASVVSLTSAPTSEYDSPQGEATGHAYVQLTGTGQSVQWTNDTGTPVDFVNIRASIPDSSAGGGITATLDLYVNGTFRQAINMNSIQTWQYEGNGNYSSSVPDQKASDGDPRDFWDDFNAFVTGSAIAPGSTVSLVKDSSNTASFYWVNSIDLFDAPAPLTQPANSISITSCGATADNTPTNGTAAAGATDSTADIQNCVSQAESQNKILWIPQGTFYVIGTQSIPISNITIEGAGYLYSELYRDTPLPNSTPLGSLLQCTSCHIQDFHIDTNSLSRGEADGGGGAEDTTGTNWSIESMWVQHVESSVWASGTGGTVENNYFTDIFADGCNINNVSLTGTSGSNITVENNFIRGTGDDAMAINSVANNGSTTYTAMSNITMEHNSLLAPWAGKGIGVYGGSGHHVEDNYIADTARYIGLGVGRFGTNGSDMTGANVSGNVVVRSGGNAYFQGQPAMQIGNGGDGQNVGVVSNTVATGNTIINPVYDGLDFSTSTSTTLSGNQIINPWRNGIVISPQYYPAPSGNATITGNSVTGLASGMSAFLNDSSGFTATTSGNSWQNGTAEAPYGGTSAAVPGTVQAANYDAGGQAVAYYVSSVNGTDTAYRSDAVDLEKTSDTGSGDDLAWTAAGQWFKYTVNVATAGTYTVNIRAASTSGVSDAFHLTDSAGNALTGAEAIPATGGAQTWTTVSDTVTLSAGQQTITVDQDNSGWSLHYLAFSTGVYTTPSALSFGSLAVGQTSSAQSVSVLNPTSSAAAVSSIAVTGPFAETNNCGSSIAAGGSCTASVTFTPTAAGAQSGTLTVTAGGVTSTTTLSGTGTAPGPVLGASPGALSFPNEVVGTAAPSQTVTVSNSGTSSATVSSVAVTGPYTETNNCSTVAVNGSCTVTVGFTPTANGANPGTLTITSNANNSPTTVTLSGSGIGSSTNLALAGTMTASSSASGFPASNANDGNTSSYWESLDGSAYPQTLTANLGHSYPLGSVTLTLPPSTAWSTRTETLSVLGSANGTTYTTLVPSANYTLNPATGNTVSINLPSGTNDQYLELSFTANTGWNAAQVSEFEIFPAAGSGNGSPSATLSASPSSLSFGNQNTGTTSAAQSVTISNTGTAAASISSISTAAPYAETNTCGGSLAAGATCTASVTFAPTATGSSTGSLSVASNASNSTLTVALSGTGTASSTDLALNRPVTASSSTQNYAPANAVDGNTSTYWESVNGSWPATYTVDLGSTTTIGSTVLDLPPSSAWQTRTQTLSVLGSTNDSTWATLAASATYTWNPSTGNTVTITLPSGTAERYVQLDFTANSVQNGAQMSELEVFS